jgi:hypothetical protein
MLLGFLRAIKCDLCRDRHTINRDTVAKRPAIGIYRRCITNKIGLRPRERLHCPDCVPVSYHKNTAASPTERRIRRLTVHVDISIAIEADIRLLSGHFLEKTVKCEGECIR